MELLILLVLGLLVSLVVLPFVALIRANVAKHSIDDLSARLSSVENQVRGLREREAAATEPQATAAARATPKTAAVPPPLPVPVPVPSPLPKRVEPQPQILAEPARAKPAITPKPSIDWEQFMGAKLFAWIGGLALFLGVAFFVKYSFEHNLIPPEARVAIGFAVGLVLVVGGLALKRKENAVTAQTLCATGTLILYAVTFACRSFYHFAFFGLVPTFLLMTLITAVAFLLAVRLNAIAVAILGMAGGFLTPILLSTGQDNPFGLFGYIALLDIGLLMVARRKEWSALPILGAIGTVLMQIGWVTQFFLREEYFLGDKVFVPMAIFLGFELLFCTALASTKHASKSDGALSVASIGMGAAAILWGFYFLSFQAFGFRPVLLLSYI